MKELSIPFTEDQVKSIQEFQLCDRYHPFTCNKCPDATLQVRADGFYCLKCDYTQDWCHDFMANWEWKEYYGI